MKFLLCCFTALIIFSSLICSFAQDVKFQNPPKTKEQIELETKTYELLAEVTNETASLKLAENRAYVYAIAGNLYWEKDEKLARRMFGNAVSELTQAQNNPKRRFQFGDQNYNYWTVIHNLLRERVVYSILPKDAEMALAVFYATRTAETESAVQFYRQLAAQTGESPYLPGLKDEEKNKLNDASLEIREEQDLKKEVAKDNPQMMAENLRESIAGNISYQNILPDIEALNKKDHDAAQKILDEFMEKLSGGDYLAGVKGFVAYLLYEKFLKAQKKSSAQAVNNKNNELDFDEKQIKAIAGKKLNELLMPDGMQEEFNFVENAIYIKRVLPDRYGELKPKLEKLKNFKERIDDMEAEDKLGDNPTIAQIAENTANLYPTTRNNYYSNAVNELAKSESQEKIAQMLQKIPDEKDREKALEYLNRLTAGKTKNDNPDAAKKAALQIKNEKDKIAALVNLAISYHQKNTDESQKIAEDLMTEAGAFVNQTPATETDFERFLPFIAGYAEIKPEKAFGILPPVIEKSNELINAYVVLLNYHDKSYPYVEENEMIFGAQDGYGSYSRVYGTIIKKLAENDFERTNNFIKTFQRSDVRIAAKLILAQSILAK